MPTPEDIAAIKRRLGALEYEFGQLQRLVAALEAAPLPGMPGTSGSPLVPPVSAVTTPAWSQTTLPEAPPPVTAPVPAPLITARAQPAASALPPILPPVLIPGVPLPQSVAPAPILEPAPIYSPLPVATNPLREWLEPLQLWPPAGEDNAEVRLAAWWATRVGALLAVIGIVFLGIYVSRNSPPWVRLAEVMVVTAGVIGLGSWLERKLPKFGAVVFGAGLALAYFCAFAAYAVAPMKVIVSPLTASVCELLVVGGILAVAWRRNSPLVATMAVGLGYVTAFLALRDESAGFGPWVVLLLGIAAVIFRLARSWEAPSALGMPLTWLFLAAAAFARGSGLNLSLTAIWVWAGLYLVLFMARDWLVASRGVALGTMDRSLQVINSSLAVVIGLMAALRAGGDHSSGFFLGSGAVMLLAAWAWRQVGVKALVPIFVCKGSGLIALGIIDTLAGQSRCLVLLAQAFVMLVSARHSHQRWLRMATVLAGMLALVFFLEEIRPIGAQLRDPVTALELVFLAGAVGFVAALRRWIDLPARATGAGAAVLGIVAIVVVSHWDVQGWTAAVEVGVAIILMVAAGAVRGWLAGGVAAGLVVIAAHLEIWLFDRARFSIHALWGSELVLLAAALAAATVVQRVASGPVQQRLRVFVVALGGATLVAAFFKGLEPASALAAGVALSVLFIGTAPLAPKWNLAAFSAPVIALACGLLLPHTPTGSNAWLWFAAVGAWAAPLWLTASRSRQENLSAVEWREALPAVHVVLATGLLLLALMENLKGEARIVGLVVAAGATLVLAWRARLGAALEASWLMWCAVLALVLQAGAHATAWMAAGVAWLPAILLARVPGFQALRATPPTWRARADAIQVALAAALGGCLALEYAGSRRLVAFAVVIGLGFVAWRVARVSAARPAVVALAAAAWFSAVGFSLGEGVFGWGGALASVLGIAALVLGLPFLLEHDCDSIQRTRLRWPAAAAGLGLAFLVLLVQPGEVAPYATVGCGLAAVGTFLAGLVARSRPHRWCGLAGLALCVPRAFLVDLNSTLHRIMAFVALGVVLLWVGFSYHRFRHLIVEEDKKL